MRLYSFIDMGVFALALTRNPQYILGILLLWISFLLYLESQHRDALRLRIRNIAWFVTYVPTLFLLPMQIPILVGFFGIMYTFKKKNKFFGLTSPIWRGLQNFSIAYFLNPSLAILAFVLTFFRNVIGDFRDAGDDGASHMFTIPIVLGCHKNQTWAFYGHLLLVLLTTYIWFQYSSIPNSFLYLLMLIQIISYPITPRLSNPWYLNLYNWEKKILIFSLVEHVFWRDPTGSKHGFVKWA